MKLDERNIGYRFLTNEILQRQLFDLMTESKRQVPVGGDMISMKDVISPVGQRAYFITPSVIDKLHMLKVKPVKDDKDGFTYWDWSIFSFLSDRKVTFIYPNNRLLRLFIHNGEFVFMEGIVDDKAKWEKNFDALWNIKLFNREYKDLLEKSKDTTVKDRFDYFPSETYTADDDMDFEEFTYKVMCFLFLSENEELIIPPGAKHGTKKSGKVVNDMDIPVTVVTSKWNVTSVRTEGFDVSGHFRLQPTKTGTKMIFIQPFRKHGYVRRAKSESQ